MALKIKTDDILVQKLKKIKPQLYNLEITDKRNLKPAKASSIHWDNFMLSDVGSGSNSLQHLIKPKQEVHSFLKKRAQSAKCLDIKPTFWVNLKKRPQSANYKPACENTSTEEQIDIFPLTVLSKCLNTRAREEAFIEDGWVNEMKGDPPTSPCSSDSSQTRDPFISDFKLTKTDERLETNDVICLTLPSVNDNNLTSRTMPRSSVIADDILEEPHTENYSNNKYFNTKKCDMFIEEISNADTCDKESDDSSQNIDGIENKDIDVSKNENTKAEFVDSHLDTDLNKLPSSKKKIIFLETNITNARTKMVSSNLIDYVNNDKILDENNYPKPKKTVKTLEFTDEGIIENAWTSDITNVSRVHRKTYVAPRLSTKSHQQPEVKKPEMEKIIPQEKLDYLAERRKKRLENKEDKCMIKPKYKDNSETNSDSHHKLVNEKNYLNSFHKRDKPKRRDNILMYIEDDDLDSSQTNLKNSSINGGQTEITNVYNKDCHKKGSSHKMVENIKEKKYPKSITNHHNAFQINTKIKDISTDSPGVRCCREIQEYLMENNVPVSIKTLSRGLLPPTEYCFSEFDLSNPENIKKDSSTTSGLVSKPSYWLPEEFKEVQRTRKLAFLAMQSNQKKKSKKKGAKKS